MKTIKYVIAGFISAFLLNNQAQAVTSSNGESIVEIAAGSKDHTTLVAALKAADLRASDGVIHVTDAVSMPKL
jgi:uncharacterized surface protein with fasciclin (FAS1) repeats